MYQFLTLLRVTSLCLQQTLLHARSFLTHAAGQGAPAVPGPPTGDPTGVVHHATEALHEAGRGAAALTRHLDHAALAAHALTAITPTPGLGAAT